MSVEAPRRKLALLGSAPPQQPAPNALAALRQRLRGSEYADPATVFGLDAAARPLKTTISLCPVCLAHVPAVVYAAGGRVFIRKHCPDHARSEALLESDANFYFLSSKDASGRCFAPDRVFELPPFAQSSECCGGGACSATPQLANKTCTLLVEVTDACNLACPVCYAVAEGERKLPLPLFKQYIEQLLEQKGGLDSIQLTGGEAMLHPDFWQMVQFLFDQPKVGKIYLPTNGILLARREVAQRLQPFASKVMALLQFDGESEAADRALRGAKLNRQRRRALQNLAERGIPTQLTMTVVKGQNEQEVGAVIDIARKHRTVKVIALQPATYSGRYELAPDTMTRLTLSDLVKAVVKSARLPVSDGDFLPIPCSHPNCGWLTVFVRRFGVTLNVARHVDLPRVISRIAYRTLLSTDELREVVGTSAGSILHRLVGQVGRRLVRSQDVLTIAIKPFMDRYSYDQDRIDECCHHMLDTRGGIVSFCEYNALLRRRDPWDAFPKLDARGAEPS